MFGLCIYKNILGEPGEGLHSYRLGGFAFVDIIFTIIAAWILWQFGWIENFWLGLIGLVVIGEILHWIFCVDTRVIQILKGE